MAAGHSVDVERWQAMFEGLMGRVAGRFARVEPRRRARSLVLGLLSALPRENCRTIVEHAGDTSPHGMQHLLGRAKWDADALILRPAHTAAHRLRWSHWRRRHQARARDSHHLRQAAAQP